MNSEIFPSTSSSGKQEDTPVLPENVPVFPTPLIGREQDVEHVCTLLQRSNVRVLTLTGPGGVGKTRLGLEVISHMRASFDDGVYFISLAPISDPNLVLSTIARQLDVKEAGNQPILDLLIASLRDRHVLLLLDNVEQVVAAAPMLAELLTGCPRLKLLVTGRAVLHMDGEHVFTVHPLALPDLKQTSKPEVVAQYAAVMLFLQRVQAIKPNFLLTTANAQSVADICIKLDGLPLAIELAAARIRLLPPHALLARLSQRLSILTRGASTLPTRQQTLRNTLQWSYNLLDAQEQQIFRYLSVFVGDFTLEAAEHVCNALQHASSARADSVLDGVDSLLENSLLQQREVEEGVPRLFMLETMREYGLESLVERGEMDRTRQQHTIYYQALAHEAGLYLHSNEPGKWFDQLEQQHDNLRAALNWLLERGEVTHALRLSNDLFWFWLLRGYLGEGRSFLEQGLSARGEVVLSVRARSLQALGVLTINQGDMVRAEEYWQKSLVLFEEVGDKRGSAWTLLSVALPAQARGEYARARHFLEASLRLFRELGDEGSGGPSQAGGAYPVGGVSHVLYHLAEIARDQGEYVKARLLAEESLSLFKAVGDNDEVSSALAILASVALNQGEYAAAQTLLAESLVLARENGIKMDIAHVLSDQGQLALLQRETSKARVLIEESIAIWKEIGDLQGLAETLHALGQVEAEQGDYIRAQAFYEESLAMARKTHYKMLIAADLEGLAAVVAAQSAYAWAARLWGAAESLRESMETPLPPVWRAGYEHAVAAARAFLGMQSFTTLWAEGRAMPLEHVLADREPVPVPPPALSGPPATAASSPPASHVGLTPREMDVLRLLTQGLTSPQIARQLVIGLVTVNSHVRSIYSKLGVTSRSAATRYVMEHHIL